MKVLKVLTLASLAAATHAFEALGRARSLRSSQVEVEVQGHRELWGSGFSWTNLLFDLGLCDLDNCPDNSGLICRCPDCCKPNLPHIHHWCTTNGFTNSCSASGASSGTGTGVSNQGSGTAADSGASQEPTRRLSLLAYLLGAGAVAGVAAGYMYRRRVAAAATKGLNEDDEEVTKSTSLNGSGGMVKSFAAAAESAGASVRTMTSRFGMVLGGAAVAAAGLVGMRAASGSDTEESEHGDTQTPSVSRRYGMMVDGNGSVGAPYGEGVHPEFIEVAPRSITYSMPAIISSSARGIEVEGPVRPSSHYSI